MASKENLSFRVLVPVYFTANQRLEVGERIVDRILERTQSENKDKNGKSFPKYSKSYINSLDFRIAGKSKSRVDLTLTEDMLSELDVIEQGSGYVEIGYKSDSDNAGKVEGNIIGSYGRTPNSQKARDFLGIEDKDKDEIINDVELENAGQLATTRNTAKDATEAILSNLVFDEL